MSYGSEESRPDVSIRRFGQEDHMRSAEYYSSLGRRLHEERLAEAASLRLARRLREESGSPVSTWLVGVGRGVAALGRKLEGIGLSSLAQRPAGGRAAHG